MQIGPTPRAKRLVSGRVSVWGWADRAKATRGYGCGMSSPPAQPPPTREQHSAAVLARMRKAHSGSALWPAHTRKPRWSYIPLVRVYSGAALSQTILALVFVCLARGV